METGWFKEENKHRAVQEYFKQERVMTWVNCCNYLEVVDMILIKIDFYVNFRASI